MNPKLAVIPLLCLVLVPTAWRSMAQVLVAPFILYAFWLIRLWGARIPVSVLGLAVAGVVIGGIAQFSHVALKPGAFVVAGVSEGDLYRDAKINRDRMRRLVSEGDGRSSVGLYAGVVGDQAAARRVLSASPSLGGVVWGTPRWMTVTLRQHEPFSLAALPRDSAASDLLAEARVPDLLLATSFPALSLSHGHERGTLSFIARLIPVWRDLPEVLLGRSTDLSAYQTKLLDLSRMQARWTSRAHIGAALWLMGTVSLVEALRGSDIDQGELRCALRNFSSALEQFRPEDNPELEGAIRVNMGVALLALARVDPDPLKARLAGVRQFGRVARLRKKGIEVGAIAVHNHRVLSAGRKIKRNRNVRGG